MGENHEKFGQALQIKMRLLPKVHWSIPSRMRGPRSERLSLCR